MFDRWHVFSSVCEESLTRLIDQHNYKNRPIRRDTDSQIRNGFRIQSYYRRGCGPPWLSPWLRTPDNSLIW